MQTDRQARAVRHHLVPRFYLARFADKRGMVAMVGRRTGTRHLTSVRKAAVETDFYTVEDAEGGKHDAVERLLAGIEERGAVAIRRLAERGLPVDPGTRADLSFFMAVQLVRGRDHRERQNAVMDYIVKLMIREGSAQGLRWILGVAEEQLSNDEFEKIRSDMPDLEGYRIESHPNEHMRVILPVAAETLFPRLRRMTWHLIRADDPVFVTADRPIAYWFKPPKSPFEAAGLLGAAEVHFPLDPRNLLILTPDLEGDEELPARQPLPEMVNFNIAASAYEWIFEHPGGTSLADLELPEPGPVLTITHGSVDSEYMGSGGR